MNNILQGCFRMDPSERLSCAQLIQHAYFEQSRVFENYEQLLEEHSRRMRAEKHKMNRQKNQRARVSQVGAVSGCLSEWSLFSLSRSRCYRDKQRRTRIFNWNRTIKSWGRLLKAPRRVPRIPGFFKGLKWCILSHPSWALILSYSFDCWRTWDYRGSGCVPFRHPFGVV